MISLLLKRWGIMGCRASALERGAGPGNGMPAIRPLRTIAPPELEALAGHYAQLAGGWRVVRNGLGNIGRGCLVDTGGRRYFIKRFDPATHCDENIREEHQMVRHLVAGRFPTPQVLAARAGNTVTWLDGHPYALYEEAQGEDLYAEDNVFSPFRRPGHARSAGRTLARFHRLMEHFPDAIRKPFQGLTAQYELLREHELKAGLEELLAPRPALRDFVLAQPELPLVLALLDGYRQGLQGLLSALPWSMIHGDFIKRNLFFAGDEVAAVIDFDLCNLAPRLFDVCLSLQPVVFPWDDLLAGRGHPNEEAGRAFLDGYLAVQPLKPAELAALPAVLATCRFEFYVALAGLDLERGHPERARRWFEFQVDVLRWFGSHPLACDFLRP